MCKKRPFGYEDCITECWNFEWVKYFETTWGNKCQLIPTRTDMCLDKEKRGWENKSFWTSDHSNENISLLHKNNSVKKTAIFSGSVCLYFTAWWSGYVLESKPDLCLFISPISPMSQIFLLAFRLCELLRFEDWPLFTLLGSGQPMKPDLTWLSLRKNPWRFCYWWLKK